MLLAKKGFVVTILLAICFIGGKLYSVEDTIILPKTGHRKPPISFNHKFHADNYALKCIECHHTGKNIKCSSCHLSRDQGATINIKGAFHQQCLGCHRKTSGPKGCSRCHKSNLR